MSGRRPDQPHEFRYLEADEVAELCQIILERHARVSGYKEKPIFQVYWDRLESAVSAPRHTYFGSDLCPTIVEKAAHLFRSLVKDHPFLDGNKRTAAIATALFVERNGFKFNLGNEEIVKLALETAEMDGYERTLAMLVERFRTSIVARNR